MKSWNNCMCFQIKKEEREQMMRKNLEKNIKEGGIWLVISERAALSYCPLDSKYEQHDINRKA